MHLCTIFLSSLPIFAPCKQRTPTQNKQGRLSEHMSGGKVIYTFLKVTVICSFLYLIQISAFYSVLCRIVYGSESDGHPQSVGATVVVGIAVVVDIAGIGRIARTHGKQPPVGPVRKIQRITGIPLFSFNYFCIVLPILQLSLFLQH